MNALLLPGNSPRHSQWVEELKTAVAPQLQLVKTQHYHHWQTGGEMADIEYEINMAQSKVEKLNPYLIIAKSIGTVIAIKGIADKKLNPEKVILLGVPINGGVSEEIFSKWLQRVNTQVVFVQNTNDPLGSFSDIYAAFKDKNNDSSFVELSGKTHAYISFKDIANLI